MKVIDRLREAREEAKRTLSSAVSTNMEVDALFDGADFSVNLKWVKFGQICSDLFSQMTDLLETVLNIIGGGSTRILKVHKLLQKFFAAGNLNKCINPDEAVAYGAMLLAANLTGDKSMVAEDLILLKGVTSLSLGVKTEGGVISMVTMCDPRSSTKRIGFHQTVEDSQETALVKVYKVCSPFWIPDNFIQLLGNFVSIFAEWYFVDNACKNVGTPLCVNLTLFRALRVAHRNKKEGRGEKEENGNEEGEEEEDEMTPGEAFNLATVGSSGEGFLRTGTLVVELDTSPPPTSSFCFSFSVSHIAFTYLDLPTSIHVEEE
ncbi:heat shock protein 70 [Echinococcus multilocularis]|uniref:Heat shock protein 70 n=1 Tax=Echinococcus multilocularis TaxID=6211 RepID=A0A0S4MIQ5_ECHMU|nr:heat shock protein 70 [Echinococcus multilocularis]